MQAYKVLHLAAISETPTNPEEGYMKLYAKSDGWYVLDHEGNELLLQPISIVDENETVLENAPYLKVQYPLTATPDGNTIVIALDFGDEDAEGMFVHGNEAHEDDYATEEDLQAHIDNEGEVHGLNVPQVLALLHEQNTDTALGQGTPWYITVQQIHALLGAVGTGGVLKTDDAETNVGDFQSYVADTSSGNVGFILPNAQAHEGRAYRFRKAHDANAMTVFRSGDAVIHNDDDEETLLTYINKGDWVEVQSDGVNWHVIQNG